MAKTKTATKTPAPIKSTFTPSPLAIGSAFVGLVIIGSVLQKLWKPRLSKDWAEAAPLPKSGKVGEFTLGPMLADGGTATVYSAKDPAGQVVAVKIPHRGPVRFKKFVATFEREAQIGIDLRHPSIVRVLDAGSYPAAGFSKVPYFVMEYLEGQELDSILSTGPLTEKEAIGVARGVADALSWAHARGVIHRDISPRNIFVTSRKAVKVMDFGISTVTSKAGRNQKARGLQYGTPEYLAPERMQDSGMADERSDLYALGCVLYEMLAGQPPYVADTPEKVVMAHVKAPIPSLAEQGLASPALDAVVTRLLAKHPQQRYQSATEVTAKLADLVPFL